MREVDLEEVTRAVKKLAMESCHSPGKAVLGRLKWAIEKEESDLAREILEKLLENAKIAEEDRIPYCQDTGVAQVFVELGEEVTFDSRGFIKAINQGVREGYEEGYLRKSMVRDPFSRENTGDNTPAMIHVDIVEGEKLNLKFAAKGSGSENMSQVKMLTPARGWEGVKEFVQEAVEEAGPNPCPPLFVGVGIGGNLERAPLVAKKALYRGRENPLPEYREKEKELLKELNSLGIGAQGLGGSITALGVNIEPYPCHIGSLPVAVALDCHAHRWREVEL